jgi:hypothetical protein
MLGPRRSIRHLVAVSDVLFFAFRFTVCIVDVKHRVHTAICFGNETTILTTSSRHRSSLACVPRRCGRESIKGFLCKNLTLLKNFNRRAGQLSELCGVTIYIICPCISPQTLGITPGDAFFVSVASVDEAGHESLFAFPEVRCDAVGCAVPAGVQAAMAPAAKAEKAVFKDVDDE